MNPQLCDGVEDCVDYANEIPEDELNCNHPYGVECTTPDHIPTWVHPPHMCEWEAGTKDWDCGDGRDETDCGAGSVVRECESWYLGRRRNITEKQMCSPLGGLCPLCVDGQDQLNCTDQTLR